LSDPDSFVRNFATPLHRAALREDVPMMQLLLDLGADPEAKDPTFNATALGWSQHNHRPKSVAFLESIAKR
jgi:ankyrin repeat protein